jgi:hypothetical protein
VVPAAADHFSGPAAAAAVPLLLLAPLLLLLAVAAYTLLPAFVATSFAGLVRNSWSMNNTNV